MTPASAADCALGSPITSTVTCTIPGTAGWAIGYTTVVIGGGGGSGGGNGGGGAVVTTRASLIAGQEYTFTIGEGGQRGNGYSGSGGGSSAITTGSTIIAEAGGGGGSGSYLVGGNGSGAATAAGSAAPGASYGGNCDAPTDGGGQGGNSAGTGNGGAGGLAPSSCTGGPTNGSAGASAANGGGGAEGAASPVGGSPAPAVGGGSGYSNGGAAGAYQGGGYAGGGGGYGGGGSGFSESSSDNTGGGGGGSYVNPLYTSSATFAPATSGPGAGSTTAAAGSAGQITLTPSGPQVQTQASAPTFSGTAATLHSAVNAEGFATSRIVVSYSTSATLDSAKTATITPASASGTDPVDITGSVSGLTAGATYYYQISATNSVATTVGAIESFTVPSPTPAKKGNTIVQKGPIKGSGSKKHVPLGGTSKKKTSSVQVYRAHSRHGAATLVKSTSSKNFSWKSANVSLGGKSSAYFCARIGGKWTSTIHVTPASWTKLQKTQSGRGDVIRCP